MNIIQFNICPSCMHRDTCVLTSQKDKVWSCSEYDEKISESVFVLPIEMNREGEEQPQMTLIYSHKNKKTTIFNALIKDLTKEGVINGEFVKKP